VPAVSVRGLADARQFACLNLIVDIEGSELDLVEHEADFLRDRVHWIIMETHPKIVGEARTRLMLQRLEESGFEVVECMRQVLALRNMGPRGPIPLNMAVLGGSAVLE
jgi:hypothetical protein